MTSITPFLVLMMICCKIFIKGASGADKFISKLYRMRLLLQITAILLSHAVCLCALERT